MTVGKTNGIGNMQSGQPGMAETMDAVSQNIKSQIADAQMRLREVASDKEMTSEQKMKKRMEIQQEINNLNTQLRQHQIEKRKEQQQSNSAMEDTLGAKRKEEAEQKEKQGMSTAGMQAIISAESTMKQAKVQGGVATKLGGKGNTLETEIKIDASRGNSTEKKEEELAEVRKREQTAVTSQMSSLADANETLKEAGEDEQLADKSENLDTKEKEVGEKEGNQNRVNQKEEDSSGKKESEKEKETLLPPLEYKSVDIYL